MYNTLYEITSNDYLIRQIFSFETIWIIMSMISTIYLFVEYYFIKKRNPPNNIILKKIKKYIDKSENSYTEEDKSELKLLLIIFIIITVASIWFVVSMAKEDSVTYSYLYNQYQSGNFKVVEGKVENYEIYYIKEESKDGRCIKFEINGIKFDLENTSYEAGYNITSAAHCLIKQNGQKLKITYLLQNDLENQFRKDNPDYEYYDENTPLSLYFDEETGNTIVKIEELK